MSDFVMTDAEIDKLLKVIGEENFRASMNLGEEVGYGSISSARKAKDQVDYIERVIAAVPKRVRDEYERRQRKAEANKLRAQAARIERGVK
jgi:hypothetical protein